MCRRVPTVPQTLEGEEVLYCCYVRELGTLACWAWCMPWLCLQEQLAIACTSSCLLPALRAATNHVYVGDIFLLSDKDIIRNTLSGGWDQGSQRGLGGLLGDQEGGCAVSGACSRARLRAPLLPAQCEKGWR